MARSIESAEKVHVMTGAAVTLVLDAPGSRGIACFVGGTLHVTMLDGTDQTSPACPDGYLHPIQAIKIFNDSTAQDIVIYY